MAYPTDLDTDATLLKAVDLASTTLSSALTAAATTIALTSAASFDSNGGRIRIEDEIIAYTGKSGNSLTGGTRGYSSTTAVAHPAGATVILCVAADYHNNLKDALILVETAEGLTATGGTKGIWRKLSTPFVRLTGTEASAKDWRLVEEAGDIYFQWNSGTEATPTWVTIFAPSLTIGHVRVVCPTGQGDGDAVIEFDAQQATGSRAKGMVLMDESTEVAGVYHWANRDAANRNKNLVGFFGTSNTPLLGVPGGSGGKSYVADHWQIRLSGFAGSGSTALAPYLELFGAEASGWNVRIKEDAGKLRVLFEDEDGVDLFNRADGALGASWTYILGTDNTDLGIVTNEAKHKTAVDVLATNSATAQNDCAVEARIKMSEVAGAENRYAGVIARYTATQNYYAFRMEADSTGQRFKLFKVSNGSWTALATQTTMGTAALALSATRYYRLRMELSGTAITCYVDGEIAIRWTDSTHTTGSAGLYASESAVASGNVFIDDFRILDPATYNETFDIDKDYNGGFKKDYGFFQDNAAASQTSVALSNGMSTRGYGMVRAGSVLGIVVKSNAARTAGTLTVEVTKNGTGVGLTAVLDGTNTTFKATTQAKDLDTFVAGDDIGAIITTDGTWAPVTADINVTVEVEC